MKKKMNFIALLLLTYQMSTNLKVTFGRNAEQQEGTFDRQSICNTLHDRVCGNGKCVPNDSDDGYYCVCKEGDWVNKETGNCEDPAPPFETTGCSSSKSEKVCYRLELLCTDGRRIQIVDAKYANQWLYITNISNENRESHTSNNVRDSASPVESKLNNYDDSDASQNCNDNILHVNDCEMSNLRTVPYNSTQRYELFKKCSWKTRCQPPAVGSNLAHSIAYRCIPEQSTSFCGGNSTTAQLINIIFDRRVFKYKVSPSRQQPIIECSCAIKSSSTFIISVPDIRLLDSNTQCTRNAKVSGISNTDINCSSELSTLESVKERSQKKTLSLSFDAVPEFVWIIVQPGPETNGEIPTVSVDCHLPINLAPTTTSKPETDTTQTSKTSSATTANLFTQGQQSTAADTTQRSKTSSTTTANLFTQGQQSTAADTTQTRKRSSTTTANLFTQGKQNQEIQEKDNSFPLPAVIIPVVVILTGAVVVGIFVWRRRYLKHPREDDPDGQTKVTYQNQATNDGQISDYEYTKPRRTDDNYIVLEPENVYNTIETDNTDNQIESTESATIKSENVSKVQDNEYLTLKPQNNNIPGIAEENVYTPLDAENLDKQDHIDQNETVSSQSMPQTQDNTYFTLEPQNAFISGEPVDVSHTNDNNLSRTPDVVQTDIISNTTGHDYFVLHP